MKKLTALAGVLLLSSSLLTACGQNDAADRGASPDNRTERYDTTRGGRVMDTETNQTGHNQAGKVDPRTGKTANYKYGVRGAQPGAPNRGIGGAGATTGIGAGIAGLGGNGFGFGQPDQDRLGVRDNIGPDNGMGANRGGSMGRIGTLGGLGAGLGGAGILGGLGNGGGFGFGNPDQDRLGVRDNFGPDNMMGANRGGFGTAGVGNGGQGVGGTANVRADRTLESRVEALPGVRNATVVVQGNAAYVAVDRGMDANRNNTYSYGANTPGDRNLGTTGTGGTRNNMLGFGGTAGGNAGGNAGLTDDLRTRITDVVRSANPAITSVYVSANPAAMQRLDSLVRGGAGTGAGTTGGAATGTGTTAGNTAGMGTGTTTNR